MVLVDDDVMVDDVMVDDVVVDDVVVDDVVVLGGVVVVEVVVVVVVVVVVEGGVESGRAPVVEVNRSDLEHADAITPSVVADNIARSSARRPIGDA